MVSFSEEKTKKSLPPVSFSELLNYTGATVDRKQIFNSTATAQQN
jgi:hypothetical protein